VIGSLIISPRYRTISLHAHLHFRTMDSDRVVAFLADLLRQVSGRIVLLWDNAPIHGDPTVEKFLKAHPRLRCYPFPAYAPELNPAEGLWAQADHVLDDHLCNDLPELTGVLCRTFRKLKASPQHLWGCVFGSALPWKR
jgi:putative transposase